MTTPPLVFHFAECFVYIYAKDVSQYKLLQTQMTKKCIPIKDYNIGAPKDDILLTKKSGVYMRGYRFLLFVDSCLKKDISKNLLWQFAENDIHCETFRSHLDIFEYIDKNFDRSYPADYLERIIRLLEHIKKITIKPASRKDNCLLVIDWVDGTASKSYEFRLKDVAMRKEQLLSKM